MRSRVCTWQGVHVGVVGCLRDGACVLASEGPRMSAFARASTRVLVSERTSRAERSVDARWCVRAHVLARKQDVRAQLFGACACSDARAGARMLLPPTYLLRAGVVVRHQVYTHPARTRTRTRRLGR